MPRGGRIRLTPAPVVAAPAVIGTLPSAISGCQLFYRTDLLTGFAEGAVVAALPDQSGNGRNASANAGQEPIMRLAASPSGKNIVRFNGITQGVNNTKGMVTPYVAGQLHTIMAMYWCDANKRASTRVVNGSNNWLLGPHNGGFWSHHNGTEWAANGGESDQTWVVHTAVGANTGGRAAHYVNGAYCGSASVPGPTPPTPGTLGLGIRGAFADNQGFDFAGMAVWNRLLTAAERRQAELWFLNTFVTA